MNRYTVVSVPDEARGLFVAYVPTIPDCVTQGKTVEDALAMAANLAAIQLADLAEQGDELPTEAPGAVVASVEVEIPALAPA